MSGFVLDASVALSWFLRDESDAYAEAVLEKLAKMEASVPCLWLLEICNALTVLERRGRIKEAETGRALSLVRNLPIEMDETPVEETVDGVTNLARRFKISAYDASYLELAIRRGLPLATLDRRLKAAAKRAGVAAAG
jgi:predicted nucleic acid-binding protein